MSFCLYRFQITQRQTAILEFNADDKPISDHLKYLENNIIYVGIRYVFDPQVVAALDALSSMRGDNMRIENVPDADVDDVVLQVLLLVGDGLVVRVDLQDGGLGLLNLEAVEAEGHLYARTETYVRRG